MDMGLDLALGVKSNHTLSTSELMEGQAQKSSGLDRGRRQQEGPAMSAT